MNLYPDATIFIQLALFIVFWVVFKSVVVDPVLRVIAERNQRTVQARLDAERTTADAEAERARYDQAVLEQRQRMAHEAEQARHAAIEESNREIEAARANIAYELGHRREAVAKQVAEARLRLSSEAESVAGEMLARVAGGSQA